MLSTSLALASSAVQGKYFKLAYYAPASMKFHAEKKEYSEAANDKNC